MVKRLRDLLEANKNFAFETTAAGTNFVKYLKEAQEKKYEVHLLYLWLNDVELAVQRVAQRVAGGGHHIPEETIRRRYLSGIKNLLKFYLPLSNSALILDNSELTNTLPIIASKNVRDDLNIIDVIKWKKLEELADA